MTRDDVAKVFKLARVRKLTAGAILARSLVEAKTSMHGAFVHGLVSRRIVD